ncbi:hypothetical protein AMTR_s00025p00244550 [Amborella trichopoda]|uniref:Malectin-like domain-containing protein n=2 Tax=Amborella trichopoda TaxID=13333 RepID=W1PXI7_AMBTC|nr:hypothetical protein AMTR_s00025p00244550 [Amborella trichopoda]
MSLSLFFIWFIALPAFLNAQSPGLLLDCGAPRPTSEAGLQWLPDSDFINTGNTTSLSTPHIRTTLSSLRYFPDTKARKFCYVLPVIKGARYLVRTTFFYGSFDGGETPPIFDQLVEGTLWSTVNTSSDYALNLSSYYEIMVQATGKSLSVCLARNSLTRSHPFISSLELTQIGNSVYNSTDFSQHALATVARDSFGYGGPIIRYPDDHFDRFWGPFTDSSPTVNKTGNVSSTGFWNMPPARIFKTSLTSNLPNPLELQWPLFPLPNSSYYVALYFEDNREIGSSRVFNVSVNGVTFFRNLNVTTSGVVVFATMWPLSGHIQIVMTPAEGSTVGPLINGGEILQVLMLGGRTVTRDVIALEVMKRSLAKVPLDWQGDPCLPRQYSWTGVTCSEGSRIRVIALNLTGLGLSGSLSPRIANLTALSDIWLGNNNLSGSIPDFSPLRRLVSLHLENNQFSGEIPPTLGNISGLRELWLQNNNLTGVVPNSLQTKPGLDLRVSPGNRLVNSMPGAAT